MPEEKKNSPAAVDADGFALGSGKCEIQSISRTNPAHLNAAYDDGIEDWGISAALTYKNEFDEKIR